MSTAPRFIGVGVAFGLAAGVLVSVGLTGPGRAAAAAPSAAPSPPASITATGTSVALPPVVAGGGGVASSGTAIASWGAAIAYPYFGGSSGVAPDHTIVVTGVGQVNLKNNGSNQAAAQKTALTAALADAKAQADLIAADTGLTITGVLSVSASIAPGYAVMPMADNGAGVPSCIVPPSGATGSGRTVTPQPVCVPDYQQTLSVSVTVEYRVA